MGRAVRAVVLQACVRWEICRAFSNRPQKRSLQGIYTQGILIHFFLSFWTRHSLPWLCLHTLTRKTQRLTRQNGLLFFFVPLLLSIPLWPYLATTDDSNTYVNPIHMPLTDRVIFILSVELLSSNFSLKLSHFSFYSMWFVCRRACTLQV